MAQERDQLMAEILEALTDLFRILHAHVVRHALGFDFTMPQFKILLSLYFGGPSSMGHLAHALGVTLPTVTGIVERLVEQGLVQRQEDPRDRRLVIISLTEEGRKPIDQFMLVWRTRIGELLGKLSLEDLRSLAQGYRALHAAAAAEGAMGLRREEGAPTPEAVGG